MAGKKKCKNTLWTATFSGGSKGGREAPLAQNFFIFMQFSGKVGQIIGWRPPLRG